MKKYKHELKNVANNRAAAAVSTATVKEVPKKEKFIENFDALIAQEKKEQLKSQTQVVSQIQRQITVQTVQHQQSVQSHNPFKSPGSNENSTNSLLASRVNVLAEVQVKNIYYYFLTTIQWWTFNGFLTLNRYKFYDLTFF
jgi:hypothetical protein